MGFELISSDINGLVNRRYLTDVTIHRRIYGHSQARVVLDWDEHLREGDKSEESLHPTADLGASMLDTDVQLTWKGKDLEASTECFGGYVTGVSALRDPTRSRIVLECISYSKRTDLVPRFRVWQACTLLDICQHVASNEPLIEISSDAQSVLGGITIDLSVQFAETDFGYLSRMLHAWGIPLATDDRAGKVVVGSPEISGSGPFPELNWHWSQISLEGALVPVDARSRNTGGGAVGIAKQYENTFNQNLNRTGADYYPHLDEDHYNERTWIAERVYDTTFHGDPAVYRVEWENYVFDRSPGTGVEFGEQTYLVREAVLTGHPTEDKVTQALILQDYLAPLQHHRRKTHWASRTLWGRVTKNNYEDPQQRGRVQVEFDLEELDATGDQRCWLPTVTPYGGLKGRSGTSGFLSLPEVGEHVLVQFLGNWDSDAVVLGAVREYAREGFIYDPHETKRWQTPSGNQVTLTTRDDTDIVRLKCQDKLIFEGKITPSKQIVIMDLADSGNDRVHFEAGAGPTRLDVFSSGEIYMHAGQKLYIEGGEIQITSTMGNVNIKAATTVDIDGTAGVNIDGALVKLNTPPALPHWSLQPLQLDPDDAEEGPKAEARERAEPPAWVPALAAAGEETPAEERTWIEIELVDDDGNAVPNERFRIRLPDGSIREGRLDANGRARWDGIEPGTAEVCFPDIDANDWRPA